MANIDWSKLTFSYTKTNTILTTTFKDGAWTPVESFNEDDIKISSFAGAMHYAIECFEGLKAFRGKDGRIRLFRPEENAKRLKRCVLPLLGRVYFPETNRLTPKEQRKYCGFTTCMSVLEVLISQSMIDDGIMTFSAEI